MTKRTCFSLGSLLLWAFRWCCSSLAFDAYCLWQKGQLCGREETVPTVAEKVGLTMGTFDCGMGTVAVTLCPVLFRADSGSRSPGWFLRMCAFLLELLLYT